MSRTTTRPCSNGVRRPSQKTAPREQVFRAWTDPDGSEMTIGYVIAELVEPELLVLRSDPMPQMARCCCAASAAPPRPVEP
ncbi:MAG TPA: hypothetical protein VLK58_21495 [Conexibacter sp.]|nr:hypothetical protein [Conexibacter sp.]